MKVKLVHGPAKCGKTSYVIKSFIENIQKNPVLIVPSAETLRWAKRAILSENGLAGFCGRRILTFDHLVNILAEDVAHLSHIGKIYLLKDIVSELKLRYFEPVRDYNGFYEVLGAFISELKQGQITPEDFLKGLKQKGLTDKDKELSSIYSVYQEKLNKLNLYDHEGKFWLAQKILEDGNPGPFSDCGLLLADGFQNFSPMELKILQVLGKLPGEVIITLTLQKESSQERTYNRLKETFNGCEELALAKGEVGMKDVEVIACPGQAREVEEIAKEIKRLITRRDKKPNDIAVLFRDLTPYKELIASEFKRYGIPYSISEGYPLRNSPIVRCIMSLFEIPRGNWSREAVFNFLKSNYVNYKPLPVIASERSERSNLARRAIPNEVRNLVPTDEIPRFTRDAPSEQIASSVASSFAKATEDKSLPPRNDSLGMVDRIAEVCRKAGIIEGKNMWLEKLSPGPERDYICKFISMVEELEKDFNPSTLRKLIIDFGMETQVGNNINFAKEEINAYTKFIEGLKELKNMEYLRMMIDTVEYPVASDPTGVQVMDVHRARGLSFPVVFIGGMLERSFPKQIQEEPFYSDRERAELREFGINIEEAKARQNEELFLFYMATHTAKEQLYLTYPATDNEGKEQLPSHYIDKVNPVRGKASNGVKPEKETKTVRISDVIPQLDSLYTKDYLIPRIMFGIWQETEPGGCITFYNHLIKEKDPLFRQVVANSFLEERECTVVPDFGKDYAFSISQFNKYGTCPFSYFCERLLYLEPIEPPEEELTPIDEGNLYHAILWEFYTGLREERDGNTVITPDEVDEMVSKISRVAEKHFQRVEKEGQVNNMALWRIKKGEIIKNLKNVILYEAETGNPFRRPAYFEISFGMKKGPDTDKASVTKPLVIDSVKIRGKIDRIDIIEPNMFSVADYKAGGTQIRLGEILNGTNIQLPVYILAVNNLCLPDMEPYEGYFWHLKTKKYFHANPLARYKGAKPNPEWNNYIDSAIKYVREYAQGIRQGKFPVSPKGDCPSYCDYKDICRK